MMPPNSTLQLTANAALLSVLWGKKKAANPLDNNCWARKQIAYMLGDSGQSFVVGFGKAPEKVPHRAASCPEPGDEICTWQTGYLSSDPNPHILYGGLVGGPTKDDGFYDDRCAACWRLLALLLGDWLSHPHNWAGPGAAARRVLAASASSGSSALTPSPAAASRAGPGTAP